MDCKETNRLLTAYLDNELSDGERARLKAHLDACPACRKDVEALAATQAKFRQALKMLTENTEPSEQAWAALREQILSQNEKELTRVLPSGESLWERVGRLCLFPRRLTWKTATAGVLVVILIVTAAITVPLLTGQDSKVLAEEIALADPNVQVALAGDKPSESIFSEPSPGIWKIVWKVAEGRYVVVTTDVKNHHTLSVIVQDSDDATMQLAVDIAQADPRILQLMDTPNHVLNVQNEFSNEATKMLQDLGLVDIGNLIGLTVWILPEVQLTGQFQAYIPYTFAVDIKTGEVTYLGNIPAGGTDYTLNYSGY